MRKIKYFFEAMIIIFVILSLIAPSSAVVNNFENTSIMIKDTNVIYKKVVSCKGSQSGTDVLMPSEPGNDRLPSITKDDNGHHVVTWTNEQDVSTWNMGIAFSDDPSDSMSWQGWIISILETDMIWYSDTAYIDGPNPDDYHGLYGVNMYLDTGLVGGYQIPDITEDPSLWEFFVWEGIFAQIQVCRTVEDGGYYNDPYHGHQGPLSMAIFHVIDQGYDIIGCPLYLNQDLTGDSTSYFFDAQAVLNTAPARDCDYATLPNWFHLTWEYHDSSEDIDKIVWKKIDPAVEADIEFTPWQEYIAIGTNPSIEAYEDDGAYNIAVVYVNEGSVKCMYSNDDGENWAGPVTVSTGSYPALRVIEKTLYCAYIDDGNLYLKTSEDGGISWSSAEQINDVPGSVVPEVNSVDIHPGGIVWVDARGEDLDIYWDSFDIGSPPSAPSITGPDGGKPGKSYSFKYSSIDPDGHDVRYFIDWGDGNSDTTSYSNSGDEVTISHTWELEGTYTITAKAQDIYGANSPETTKVVNMPRNKVINFPFILRIFNNYPNLFLLLKYILRF